MKLLTGGKRAVQSKTTVSKMNKQEDKKNYPETAEFLARYEKEKSKGLLDVKFFPKNVQGATVESFFGEVNEALKAPAVDRPDFL